MDPTTTLVTFMLQTAPYVRSVQLTGSWDNFTKNYTMQRDVRRARGQWRGCFAFDNIIYDGDGCRSPNRKGGLKMGHNYWYYYKIDGDIEIHDSTLPSTSACPLLPGQPVNVLSVPVEQAPVRDRSASVGSHAEPLKTMNPDDKYETPRPPPPTPRLLRLNTSPGHESYTRKRTNRSESPRSSRSPWSPKVLFGPKSPAPIAPSPSRGRGSRRKHGDPNISYPVLISRTDEGRKCVSLQDIKQQETSPPVTQHSPLRRTSLPKMDLHDDFAVLDIDDEDDANFAPRSPQLEGPESHIQGTILSPPPSRLNSVKTAISSSEHTPTLRLLTASSTPGVDAKSKPLPSIPTPGSVAPSIASTFSIRSFAPSRPPPPPPGNLSRILSPRTTPTETLLSSNSYFVPKSHFSLDSLDETVQQSLDERISESQDSALSNSEQETLPSGMISPADSDYSNGCASPASLSSEYSVNDSLPADLNLNTVNGNPDVMTENQMKSMSPTKSEFQYNPVINEVSSRGFQGYSLPDPDEYGSELTLRRQVTIVEPEEKIAPLRSARATFGGRVPVEGDGNETLGGSLRGLLDDLSYLGDAINQ